LRDRFDAGLELADLFEFQTVRRLAGRLADPGGQETTSNDRGHRQDLAAMHASRMAARRRAVSLAAGALS
jgi:hypothetical protein